MTHKYKVGDLVKFKESKHIGRIEYIECGDLRIRSIADKDTCYSIPKIWQEHTIEPYNPTEKYRFRNLLQHDYFLVAMAVIGAIAVIVHVALN